jgi:hypothetical protein
MTPNYKITVARLDCDEQLSFTICSNFSLKSILDFINNCLTKGLSCLK